jgi:hypothetical protein
MADLHIQPELRQVLLATFANNVPNPTKVAEAAYRLGCRIMLEKLYERGGLSPEGREDRMKFLTSEF